MPEEPALERLQQLVARERPHALGVTVALRDGEVVLERLVRLLERVAELVTLEDVVLGSRLLRRAPVRIDGAADGPDPALLPLDPDHDRLRVAVRVDAVEHPLREPAAVGGRLHAWTIASPGRRPPPARARPPRRRRRRPTRRARWT